MSLEARILSIHDRLAVERKRVVDLINAGRPTLMRYREDGSLVGQGSTPPAPLVQPPKNLGLGRVARARNE
jgi:hypothetical protein